MRKSISLLGSTGSIGRQTLEIADLLGLKVCALSAHGNIRLLEEQVRKFKPETAIVFDGGAARDFQVRVRDTATRVTTGMEGLIDAACTESADTVVNALVGTAGLRPTLAAARCGKRIALANKETLVCAGETVMRTVTECGAEIIPVDSEHSAVFQCMRDNCGKNVKRIILTASGGPFRGMNREYLCRVTPEMALRHPNWSMGKKVTIDSATMMNKGLEVIEAVHLFSVSPEKIDVTVHPESIIHSMVEYEDNSVIAQLAKPDMRLPIQYALTYPKRLASLTDALDFAALKHLTFFEPDMEVFPCLRLALDTAKLGGIACAVMNGANEAAVELFLNGQIGFYGIYESVYEALENIENIKEPSLDDILAADAAARRFVFERAR